MTHKKETQSKKEKSAPINKSLMMVSVFMATALVGCGQTSPAAVKPADTSASTQQVAPGNTQQASTSNPADPSVPPYGGTQKDYCQDDNNDGLCDDNGEAYDKQYAYSHNGENYYGRSSSVSAGTLVLGALAGAAAGAAIGAAAANNVKGAGVPPVVPTTPPAVSQPAADGSPKPKTESSGGSNTSAPSTTARSGSFNSNTSGGTTNSTSSKSTGASTSSNSSGSIGSSSGSSSNGISSGISGPKGGIGSSYSGSSS